MFFLLLSLAAASIEAAEFEDGIRMLKAGRTSEGVALLETARLRDPGNPDVLFALAQTYFALGRGADAGACVADLAKKHADDPVILTALGSLLVDQSKFSLASTVLSQAERSDPSNPMLLSLLAKAQLANGDGEKSAVTLTKLLSVLKATTAVETQKAIASGAQTSAKLSEQTPGSLPQALLAAEFAVVSNRFSDAVRILSPFAAPGSKNPDYLNLLAAAYAGSGELPKAAAAGERALKLAPTRQEIILNAAGVYQKMRDNQSAVRILNSAISRGVASAEIYFALALSEFNFGKNADAVRSCDRSLALDPQFDRALLLKGRAYARMGHAQDAIETFRQGLQRKPDCDFCRYELAKQLTELGQAGEAESLVRELVSHMPAYAPGQYELGKLLAARGETPAAIAAFEAAVRVDENYENAWYQLGKLYRQTAQSEKADSALATVKRIKELRRSAAEARTRGMSP